MGPVHNHTAGSFRKSSSKARRTEAKRARFFARQQVLATASPSGPKRGGRRAADDAEPDEERVRPPLDLVPIRAGDGALGEELPPQAGVAMSSPPPASAPRKAAACDGSMAPCSPSAEVDERRAVATPPPQAAPQTPERGGGARGAQRPPAGFACADLISRRCYEHAADAWRDLNGALFEQMPYELRADDAEQPRQRAQPAAASEPAEGIELGFLQEHSPARERAGVHAGEGLLVEAAEPIEIDLDEGEELGGGAWPPGGSSFHQLVVQQTFHWRSMDSSPFPATPVHMPMLHASSSRTQRWAQLGWREDPQREHGFTPTTAVRTSERRSGRGGEGGAAQRAAACTFDEFDEEEEEEEARRVLRP